MQQPKKNCIEDENLHIIETFDKDGKIFGIKPQLKCIHAQNKTCVLHSRPVFRTLFTLVAK
jgi:hypothetical protein